MIDLRLKLVGDLQKFAAMPFQMKQAQAGLVQHLLDDLRAIIDQNLSGKVLQERTGALRRSIQVTDAPSPTQAVGLIGPVPASPKAAALEFGGKGDYVIRVGLKGFLANEETGFFSKRDVIHHPSKAYGYLRLAAEEIRPKIADTWVEVFDVEGLGR